MGCGSSCEAGAGSAGGIKKPVSNAVHAVETFIEGVDVALNTAGAVAKTIEDGNILGTYELASGVLLQIPDITVTHSHDPYVATVQSWFRSEVAPKFDQVTQVDLDKAIKAFFRTVKKYNVDTHFSANNSIPSHLAAVKQEFEDFKAKAQQKSSDAQSKWDKAAEYARIFVIAGIGKLVGGDEGGQLADTMVKFTEVDPLWATTVLEKLKHPGAVMYRPAPSMDAYVYPLRSKAGSGSMIKIGLISDWATGTPQAYDLLRKVAAMAPDVVLHLGDCYYSGTETEEREFVLDPATKVLQPLGIKFWNLPGNHDLYAGGGGYYTVVDELRKGGFCQQEGSFFCLEGDHWVIVTMDTAQHDANPLETVSGAALTWIDAKEAEWVRDKVHKAKANGKKIMFMSHHQWATLCSTTGKVDGVDQALNINLYKELKDVVGDVAVWYWGHEHSLQFFKPYAGLKAGRLIGNGSVPTLLKQTPYQPKAGLVAPNVDGITALPVPVPNSPQMTVAAFGHYYNCSFVILTLEGDKCTAQTYDVPWLEADITRGNKWGEPLLRYTEEF